ncbi:bifunctional aminodeoxychorismate synthase component I/aminodeoxychorismate lyase, partial [Neisseria sp. P0016.S009]
ALTSILQAGWQKGLHGVLFADYEFGLSLIVISSARSGNLRLHWFADWSEIDAESWLSNHSDGIEAGISTPRLSVSEADYLE